MTLQEFEWLLEGFSDETTVQVLKASGRPAISKSFKRVQTGSPPRRAVVIDDDNPRRSGEVPLGQIEPDANGFTSSEGLCSVCGTGLPLSMA